MKITRVKTYRVTVPSAGEYKMALGTHTALRSLVARIHTDAGISSSARWS